MVGVIIGVVDAVVMQLGVRVRVCIMVVLLACMASVVRGVGELCGVWFTTWARCGAAV